jgi:hypothetical protein
MDKTRSNSTNEEMPKATERQYISYVGEFYDDAWTVEAVLKGRTKTAEGASLFCAKLQEREDKRNRMVQYLADKRGITFKQMWMQILTGKYEPLSNEELARIAEIDPNE